VHGEAVELARQADGKIGDIDHPPRFADLRADLPISENQCAPGPAYARAAVADLAVISPRLGAGIMRHSRRTRRPRHHGFVIRDARHSNARQGFARGGTEGNQLSSRGFGDPISVAGAGIYCLDVQFLKNIGNYVACGKHTFILALGVGHRCRDGFRARLKAE
jgi:hypothetical protein